MIYPTIYVVTPCFNSLETLDRTLLSVVTQSGQFRIRYHIQDGGSTDGTVERLKWWLSQLSTQNFPAVCLGINFSFSSEPDSGMYNALVKGFELIRPPENAFAGWINSDDVFMPGAFSYISAISQQFMAEQVSWVGGAASMMVEDRLDVAYDRHLPTAVIKEGLCDGTHWDFVQQEGTFFRFWLWSAVSAPKAIGPMKYAGDWNLWRLFAAHASYNQIGVPLAAFVRRSNQLSALHRDDYLQEINAICSLGERQSALQQLATKGSVLRRRIKASGDGGFLQVSEETANEVLISRYEKVFKKKPPCSVMQPKLRRVFDGSNFQSVASTDADKTLPLVKVSTAVIGFDEAWQFPAITEKHAFLKMLEFGQSDPGVTYVAFPWATLIDKLQTAAPDADAFLRRYKEFVQNIPQGTKRITVCQHIKLRDFLFLFSDAGISKIFWSHTTRSDFAPARHELIEIRPFPLYPVQIVDAGVLTKNDDRQYLFSFVGARANKYYLTKARDWILEELAGHPQGFVAGRDGWHYEKIVYQHQVRPDLGAGNGQSGLIEESASDEFRRLMLNSIFSLCPSGSGPNSIRLWESLGAGSIPVIISDTYLPPGNNDLWRAAAVFCEENRAAIAALPSVLEEIAADRERIDSMRLAGRQLWMLYGPDCFVYDIQKCILGCSGDSEAELCEALPTQIGAPGAPGPAVRDIRCLDSARYALRAIGSSLLLKRCRPADATIAIEAARKHLPAKDPALLHLQNVLSKVANQNLRNGQRRLKIEGKGLPKVCLIGRHFNRTPLSYEPFRKLVKHRVDFVERPEDADVLMTGFNIDFRENAEVIGSVIQKRPSMKLMVISEEPLWDTLWSGGFRDRNRSVEINGQEVRYTFLNHSNSSIFEFEKVPYFLLTNDDFPARYLSLISRHLAKTPQDLLSQWRSAPLDYAFFGEYRDEPKYDVDFKEQSIFGLSAFRVKVAQGLKRGRVLTSGKGWSSDARRQDLPDWHLDKLARLDGQVKVLSGFENTHQLSYVSEKPFDAFAIGSIPAYYAESNHRVHELIDSSAMINVFGKTYQQASEFVAGFRVDIGLADAWLSSASNMVERLRKNSYIVRERRRIVDAISREIFAIVRQE